MLLEHSQPIQLLSVLILVPKSRLHRSVSWHFGKRLSLGDVKWVLALRPVPDTVSLRDPRIFHNIVASGDGSGKVLDRYPRTYLI